MSKFNQKINEMLVVLNAVKKAKKDKDEDRNTEIDPVTSVMNRALGDFGVSVENPSDPDEDEGEDDNPIEGSIDKIEDLDLPRPVDTDDDEGANFDFMSVGKPVEVGEPKYDENGLSVDDDDGSEGDSVKFEYEKGKGVVISIGDASATLTPEHAKTVLDFLSSLDLNGMSSDGEDKTFGGEEDENDDDDEGDDDEEEDDLGEARFDDSNPKTKKCKCGGTMNYDQHSKTYKCSKCHNFEKAPSHIYG